jgi:hypothetical protein
VPTVLLMMFGPAEVPTITNVVLRDKINVIMLSTHWLPEAEECMRVLSLIVLLLTSSAWADDAEKLLGNWKLVSFFTEDVQTKQRVNTYGENPMGAIGFTLAGRYFAFLTADGRKAPQTQEEQAAAYRTMIAYTGKWRVEGDKFITKVDVAWNPAWVGTEQARFWRVEGNKLFLTSAPIPNPNAAGSMVIATVVWEREQ